MNITPSTERSKARANRSASLGARLTRCAGSTTSAGHVEDVSRAVAAQLEPRQGSAALLCDFGLGRRAEWADGLSHGFGRVRVLDRVRRAHSRRPRAQRRRGEGSRSMLGGRVTRRRRACPHRMNRQEPRSWLLVRLACAERSAASGAGATGSERIDVCHSAFFGAAAFAFAGCFARRREEASAAYVGRAGA
jgi:hypothetical protein